MLYIGLISFKADDPFLDKNFAKEAFDYLNSVRQNPSKYSKEIGSFLISIKPIYALKWNDTLAALAETKAMDMAKKGYFDHVDPKGLGMNYYLEKGGYHLPKDWLKNKKDNYVESIGNNYQNAKEAIQNLIIDEGVPGVGHRKHLLGLGDFYSKNVDIGIGHIVLNSNQGDDFKETYTCILIARHSW